MRYRTLGRTGLKVSEISLGTVELGMDYGIPAEGGHVRPTEAEAARLLDRTLELGINFIDTARAYGEAEAVIGRALHARRSEYIIATKVQPFDADEPAERERKMVASAEESLRLLQLDSVDLFMLHSAPSTVIAGGHAGEVLLKLKQRGLCRFIGASVYGEESALAAIETGVYDCLQIAYSVLDRRPEARVIPAAAQAGVGLVSRSVLLKGALTARYRYLPAGLAPLIAEVERVSAQAPGGVDALPELAYRYVLSSPVPQTALVGTANISELEAAVRYAEAGPLDAAALQTLRAAPLLSDNELNPGKWPAL